MKKEVIDIREEIKNRMKSFDYDNKDMKKRMNKYVLFEKFMAKESFLTIDLAMQIGTILNMDPLDLINKEVNFMKSLEGDNYKIHDKTVQEIEVTINTMKEEKRISK